jgi:hypothetical protein
MDYAQNRRRLIRLIRIYPLIALTVLSLAYLLGGFSDRENPLISQDVVITALYLFVGAVPLLFIIGFIAVGKASDKAGLKNNMHSKLNYNHAFDLPSEVMHGYKLALITARPPTLTGLTGDVYLSDASAKCTINKEHVPPVADCECGFYAYSDLTEAKFERSINPGAFLLDVDLYGLGFKYARGYRAETQVVNKLITPSRCQFCRILPAKVFVTTYKLGYDANSWWQWQIRCVICSSSFKDEDKLSIDQMGEQLSLKIQSS